MNQAMKEGHLFKQRQEVMKEALEMLNRDLQVMAVSEQDVSQVLYRLVLQKALLWRKNGSILSGSMKKKHRPLP